jgi:hypothetical protein
MEEVHKETTTPALTIDCEHLDPSDVDDLLQFLPSSDPRLRIKKSFRSRTCDSVEYHNFLTGYHQLLTYVLTTGGVAALGLTGSIVKDLIEDRIKQWIEDRSKSHEFELKTIYGPSDEPVKTVKIFKKKPKP